MRHLVTGEILNEDVKKSDMYGSISSVLKVKNTCALVYFKTKCFYLFFVSNLGSRHRSNLIF
jgi:hypothetical protein